MADSSAPIFLLLRPVFHEALKRRAQELGVTDSDAAARLVEEGLEPFVERGAQADQARAERQLLGVAADLAREEVARSSEWNERLTFTVFERIRLEHRPLYDAATKNGQANGVNRRIARHIKTAVGAKVKPRNGGPATAKAPRSSEALISEYTLLLRGS